MHKIPFGDDFKVSNVRSETYDSKGNKQISLTLTVEKDGKSYALWNAPAFKEDGEYAKDKENFLQIRL
jgi:hypothetical protein